MLAVLLCFSCRSVPPSIPKAIMGTGRMTQEQLVSFFLTQTALAQAAEADQEKVKRLAGYYLEESAAEGINADIAFVQMCLETGFLRFGGLVTADMNNFCGLGAVNAENPGLAFPDEQMGVRAHIQHLKAYASAEPLNLPSVDPRYRYVNPKGKAPYIYNLAGTWASDPAYGHKIDQLLRRMYAGL
ncbi:MULTISPECIES: glucosaminidase domain-containing protein [Treponema]|uniref:glucosaminidase domain-containing protein n=1 Tax=Treponema TaxID=157 RepID=UPI00353195EC